MTPGGGGGADWALMSFDPETGLLYVRGRGANFAYSNGLPTGSPRSGSPKASPAAASWTR